MTLPHEEFYETQKLANSNPVLSWSNYRESFTSSITSWSTVTPSFCSNHFSRLQVLPYIWANLFQKKTREFEWHFACQPSSQMPTNWRLGISRTMNSCVQASYHQGHFLSLKKLKMDVLFLQLFAVWLLGVCPRRLLLTNTEMRAATTFRCNPSSKVPFRKPFKNAVHSFQS